MSYMLKLEGYEAGMVTNLMRLVNQAPDLMVMKKEIRLRGREAAITFTKL